MTRRAKIILAITIPALIIVLVLYSLVNAVWRPQPEEIIYPEGELTSSIFVSQNNTYEPNESLSQTHAFVSVPVDVDVPEGFGAKIGSGTVYQISDAYFAYVSEYNDQYNIQDIIASQFPAALLISYVPENTRIVAEIDRRGFINGYTAEYLAERINVSDGANSVSAAVLGYALDMDDVYAGNHLFVSVGTTVMSTDSLNNCAGLLSAIMKTVRTNPERNEQMAREAERIRREIEEAEQASQREEYDEEPAVIVATPDVSSVTDVIIGVDDDYATFTLDVTWDNMNPEAVLEFYFPDGLSYADPVSQSANGARFVLSMVNRGTYTLRIMNYGACGNIHTAYDGEPMSAGN